MKEIAKLESRIRASRNIMQAFLDYSPFVMTVKDRNGRYQMANKALSDETRIPLKDIIGKTVGDFHPELADVIEANDEKVRITNSPHEAKLDFTRSNGEIVTHFVVSFPIQTSNGDEGMVGTVTIKDIR